MTPLAWNLIYKFTPLIVKQNIYISFYFIMFQEITMKIHSIVFSTLFMQAHIINSLWNIINILFLRYIHDYHIYFIQILLLIKNLKYLNIHVFKCMCNFCFDYLFILAQLYFLKFIWGNCIRQEFGYNNKHVPNISY